MSSGEELRAAVERTTPYTVGIEDEVMLLDPATLELAPLAVEALERVAGDERYKLELPAAHLEIVTPAVRTVGEAARLLHRARSELSERLAPVGVLAAAGVHPFSPGTGELNQLERYQHTIVEYGPVARRQLVCALQVHVAVGDPELALRVYNAARDYLPLIAALAANAPFYEGRDTGLASVRPVLCQLLPRQGIPPPIASWDAYAEHLRWGASSGSFHPGAWWWELRPHRLHGTLEFRVPDGQSTVADAAAIAAVVQALVAWLAERHQDELPPVPTASWRIGENRWSAYRHGIEGELTDPHSGRRTRTRDALHALLDRLEPIAVRLDAGRELLLARRLAERNGAIAQRSVADAAGLDALARWLSERFLDPPTG